MRLILSLATLTLLAGCSSWRPSADEVRSVPSERALAYQQALSEGGTLEVGRDSGGMGAGCYIAVKLDRQLAARIGTGEVLRLQVPAGTRVLGIGIDTQDDTLCGQGRLNRELAVKVTPGSEQRFRILSSNSKGFDIVPLKP
jgi:hypothetical protein